MLTCREFADFILAYLDGELPEAQRGAFDDHIRICPPCVDYLDTYKETVRLGCLCRDDGGPPPEDAPEDLVQAILAAREKA
jgi:anti-sigma factor RsiW